MPGIADNALVKAAPLIERLAAYRPRADDRIPEVAGSSRPCSASCPRRADVLARARRSRPRSRSRSSSRCSRFTLSPTMIEASRAANVIPGTCELVVDCRLLPGQTPEDVEPIIRADPRRRRLRAGGDRALRAGRARRSTRRSGRRSRTGSSRSASRARGWLPLCCAGFTDSHWLREAFGTVAYGFFPLRTMDVELAARLIHSADERIARRRPRARRRVPARRAPARWRSRARAALAGGRVRADRGLAARARLLRARRRGPRRRPLSRLRALRAAPPHAAPAPPEPCPPARSPPCPSGTRRGLSPRQAAGDVRIGEWERTLDATAEYAAAVEAVRAAIARGDVYQVNLVQHLSAPFAGDPAGSRPRSRRFGRCTAAARGDGWAIVSASPELFLARRGRRVWTCPIKGTRPLGERRRADREKDAAEHVMIVDLERNDLSRVCEPGSRALAGADGRARAGGRRRISSRRSRGRSARTSASPSCSPRRSPAAPSPARRRSPPLDLIAALEPVGRGASMGALGTRLRANGDLELALTIRTFAVAEERIHLWVGGGHRLGLRARGRDRGVVGRRRGRCSRPSAHRVEAGAR